MKEYLKPEAEYISLVAEEVITTGENIGEDDFIDGEIGIGSNNYFG